MNEKRIGVIGAGFWANPQIAAWRELGVTPAAICDQTLSRAQVLAEKYGIPTVYDNSEKMFAEANLDAVDIITSNDTHEKFVLEAIKHRVPVISQKPMATTLAAATAIVGKAKEFEVPFFVHENWRWQLPIRTVKDEMNAGKIGNIFRGTINYDNNFPVFKNQPFLKELDQFILVDMGTHILDVARFLFGETKSVYCQTTSVTPGIKGEDVATIQLKMKNDAHVSVTLSYASILQENIFPQTLVLVEGEKGSIRLDADYWVTTTTIDGSQKKQYSPKMYPWIEPAYALVQSSIVDANRNFLEALRGNGKAETTGEDNLKTLQLVYAAYDSAKTNSVINL